MDWLAARKLPGKPQKPPEAPIPLASGTENNPGRGGEKGCDHLRSICHLRSIWEEGETDLSKRTNTPVTTLTHPIFSYLCPDCPGWKPQPCGAIKLLKCGWYKLRRTTISLRYRFQRLSMAKIIIPNISLIIFHIDYRSK
jgi:hypothetical protein